jgi:Ca2+-binding EF-hand superfamily protein
MNRSVWFVMLVLLSGMALAAEPADKPQRKNTFDENFNRVDTNHDGQLSMSEAEKNAPGVALRFALMDTNHDGQVSKKELIDFVQAQRKQAIERFKQADKNGNGKLSRKEAMALPGIYARFDQIDANHDGQVTPQEIGRYARVQIDKQRQAKPADSKSE